MRNVYKSLVGKPEVKRPFRKPSCGWENIKIYLKEIGWKGVNGFICLRIGTDSRFLLTP
jgi:hypothetical protein